MEDAWKIVKKLERVLDTDFDHILPTLKKLVNEVEEQEKEIKDLEKRVL